MLERIKTDICVIGAGVGGLGVAAAAAGLGAQVVLVQRERTGDGFGDDRLAAQALAALAGQADTIRRGGRFGVGTGSAEVDFNAVQRHVRNVLGALAPRAAAERFVGLGVEVLLGEARFMDRRTVRVGDAFEITARRFIIGRGSRPAVPAIAGLPDTPYLTAETAFDLAAPPNHLIVVGGGPMGVALAQAHRRLGAAVTLVEAGRPLRGSDPEGTAIVLDQLAREGIALRTGAAVVRVERSGDGVTVHLGADGGEATAENVLHGSHLLLATGRRSDLDGLALEAARIRHDADGIVVDRRLRTSNRRVYAIGEAVKGAPHLPHLATHHAELVVRHAVSRMSVDATRALVPSVVHSDPELAEVGLGEAAARAHHGVVRALRWSLYDNDRAVAERRTAGHIKVLTTEAGLILGVTIVSPHAGEQITAWTLAIAKKMQIDEWIGLAVPYPSYAEIGRDAALLYRARDRMHGLTKPLLRRMITALRRFG